MIHFRNEGTIDIRALKTFGLSSKEGQDKIGRFGTGLKYATSVIVRNGGSMVISTGGETFSIGLVVDTFRGQEITQLTLNGEPLPFTTALGRDWEPWMAFRELYANALDEGGDVSRSDSPQPACGEETVISVDLSAFEAIYFSMEEHFVGKEETPVWKDDTISVYAGRSLFVFYRGVAVMKLKEPAAYRYNITAGLDLTEDRTAKYDWQVRSRIQMALAKTADEAVARGASDMRNVFEATLDFSNCTPSDVFIGASVHNGGNCNPTAIALVRAQLPPDADTATVYAKGAKGTTELTEALRVARACGADLSKVKFVLAAGVKVFSSYDVRDDAVYLSETIFENQEKMTWAVLEGYAEIVGNNWLANQLVHFATEKTK